MKGKEYSFLQYKDNIQNVVRGCAGLVEWCLQALLRNDDFGQSARFPVPGMRSLLLSGLKSYQRGVGYLQGMCTTTALLGLSCHAGHCGSRAAQLSRSVGYFPPLEVCMVPEAFSSVPARGILRSVSEVHCVFSNRDLPSASGRLPRAIAIQCYVWGVPWTTLTNSSREGFLCLVFVFCQVIFDLRWIIVNPDEKNSLILYICTQIYMYSISEILHI